MINYRASINEINKTFCMSVSVAELSSALVELGTVLAAPNLNDQNRKDAEALEMRLSCKIVLLEYLRAFGDDARKKATDIASEYSEPAARNGYKNSLATINNTVALIEKLHGYATVIAGYAAVTASDALLLESGERVLSGIKALEAQIATDDGICSPFGDKVTLPDVKARIAEYADGFERSVTDEYAAALEFAVPHKTLDASDEYYPLPEYDEGGKASALVLNTPFVAEARLYAAHATDGAPVYEFDVADAELASEVNTEKMFALVGIKHAAALFTGADGLPDELLCVFLRSVMRYGKKGVISFVLDTRGGVLYTAAVKSAEDTELTAMDISNTYITVPTFSETLDELTALGMINNNRDALAAMPFLGFAGLNEITRPNNRGRWAELGKKISLTNSVAAKNYLAGLRSPILFIDSGWGDFVSGEKSADDGEDFDYDGVREIDLRNVKSIIESGAGVFAVCGMIARYMTTGTGDYTEWDKLSRAEMEERVTLATKLVMRALRVNVDPQVEIVDEQDNKTAGGTCYDGGKRITYKYECCKNVTWMRDSIVHECFHALQAKLTSGGYSRRYYDELGITYGRVEEWRKTKERKYNPNTKSDIYNVHMYEADARAFETDCRRGAEYAWSGIDFDRTA